MLTSSCLTSHYARTSSTHSLELGRNTYIIVVKIVDILFAGRIVIFSNCTKIVEVPAIHILTLSVSHKKLPLFD